MSTLTDNQNFLSPLGFRFLIQKMPNVNFFIQTVNIPSVSTGETTMPSPFVAIPVGGDHLTFGSLSITYKIDEDMKNYRELHDWINGIGFPESFQQRKDEDKKSAGLKASKDLLSDGTLVILNSNMNPNLEVTFKDLYPVSLSDVQFDLSQTDVEYITATADFRFRSFSVKLI